MVASTPSSHAINERGRKGSGGSGEKWGGWGLGGGATWPMSERVLARAAYKRAQKNRGEHK